MFIDDKKQAMPRILIGGLLGVAVLIPLGGLFNDLVSGGLIAMGNHTPFRLVSYALEQLAGSSDWYQLQPPEFQIALLHGGTLWVEDAPGGGAVFYLELPGGR